MSCGSCGKSKGRRTLAAVSELNMPQPAVWGPALWTILHVAAERVGQNTIIGIRLDEVRELELLVKSFPFTLPCAICQQHSQEYLRNNPINWSGQTGPDVTEKVRRWFYNFHDHVNRTKLSPTTSIPYEEVAPKYQAITNVSEYNTIVLRELASAITFNIVKHDAAQKFRRHLGSLRSFVGI